MFLYCYPSVSFSHLISSCFSGVFAKFLLHWNIFLMYVIYPFFSLQMTFWFSSLASRTLSYLLSSFLPWLSILDIATLSGFINYFTFMCKKSILADVYGPASQQGFFFFFFSFSFFLFHYSFLLFPFLFPFFILIHPVINPFLSILFIILVIHINLLI